MSLLGFQPWGTNTSSFLRIVTLVTKIVVGQFFYKLNNSSFWSLGKMRKWDFDYFFKSLGNAHKYVHILLMQTRAVGVEFG
jgi:hypothetical protein